MHQRIVIGCVGVLVVVLLCGATAATAAQPSDQPKSTEVLCPICSKANNGQSTYGVKAGATLARGTSNALLGWTELIRQPAEEVKSGGNVLTGMAHGITHGVTRTLGGVAEVLTFWVPKTKQGYLHFSSDCPLCMKRAAAAHQ